MGFIWLIIVLLAALILALGVGMLLPRTFTVERSAFVDTPPSRLWLIISNHNRESDWRNDIAETSKLPSRGGNPVWQEKRRDKRDNQILMTTASEPSTRMVRELVDNKRAGGRWIWQIEPEGEGSRIKIRHEGEIFKPLDRVKLYLFGSKSASVEQYLSDLKQRVLHMKEEE